MNKNLLKDNVKSIIKNIEAQAEHNRVSLDIVEDEMKNGCEALKEQVKKGKAPGGAKEDVKALKKIVEKAYAKLDTKDFYVDDFTGQAMVVTDDVSKRLKKAYKKYVSKQEEKLANIETRQSAGNKLKADLAVLTMAAMAGDLEEDLKSYECADESSLEMKTDDCEMEQ